MKVVAPRVVTDAILAASNLVETDNVAYSATTSYAKGARVRRVAAGAFDPGSLFAGGAVKGWWRDFSDLSTIWQDAAKTIPGAVDQPIGFVADKSGNGNHWQQTIASDRPTLRSDGSIFWAETVGSQGFLSVRTNETYPASTDIFLALAPSTAEVQFPQYVALTNNGFGPFVGAAQGGSVQSTSQNTGPARSYVDGIAIAEGYQQETRQQLATLLSGDTAPKVLEVRNTDLTAWGSTRYGNYPSYEITGRLYATIGLPSATAEANRAALLNYLNSANGRTPKVGDGHRVYESLQAANVGHALSDAAWWLDAGPTNRWAMFDGAVGSLSHANGSISVTLKPDVPIDALAVLEVTAATVRVQISAGGQAVYDETKAAGATAGASVIFLALPLTANAAVTVTIAGATGATPVTAGALLIGNLADLGLTEAGPSIGINDFSKRQTDDFGVTSVVERGWAKRMSIRSKVDTSAVAALQQRLTTLRALPSLWIGEEGVDSLIIYGFFKEFSVDLPFPDISYCSLTIEGMTTASDLDREAPDEYEALAAKVAGALDRIAVIQSDGYLSAGEKPDIIRQATDIANEYADIVAKAVMLGVSSVAYANTYTALTAYLSGLTPAYTDTTSDTAVVAGTFNGKFSDYYLARTALLTAISAKAATLATWAGTTGAGKPADNATRNDDAGNLLRSPIKLDLATFVTGAGYLETIAGAAGRTADQYRVVLPAGGYSNAIWQGQIFIPCAANEVLYYRHAMKADIGGTDIIQAVAEFHRSDGSIIAPSVVIFSNDATSVAGPNFVVRDGQFSTPANCSQIAVYVERYTGGAPSTFRVGEPYLSRSEPGSTRNDQAGNDIAGPNDLTTWLFYNGAARTAELRPRAQLASTNARVDFSNLNHCNGGQKIFFRYTVRSDGGGSEICNASYYYLKQDGTTAAVNLGGAPYNSARRLDEVSAADTIVEGSFVLPSDAKAYCLFVERQVFTSNSFFVDRPFSGPTQPAADVTAQAVVQIELTTERSIAADYQGNITGPMPVVFSPTVRQNNVSLKLLDTTSYALSDVAGGTVTLSSANGAANKGDVSVTALSSNKVTFTLVVTIAGVNYGPFKCSLVKNLAAAPLSSGGGAGGGTGGTSSASLSTDRSTTSAAYANAHSADPPTLALQAGQKLYVALSADYYTDTTAAASGAFLAEYSANAGGTWSAFGAAVTGSNAFGSRSVNGDYQDPIPGHVDLAQNVAGLSAGNYLVRLTFRSATANRLVALDGRVTFEAKP